MLVDSVFCIRPSCQSSCQQGGGCQQKHKQRGGYSRAGCFENQINITVGKYKQRQAQQCQSSAGYRGPPCALVTLQTQQQSTAAHHAQQDARIQPDQYRNDCPKLGMRHPQPDIEQCAQQSQSAEYKRTRQTAGDGVKITAGVAVTGWSGSLQIGYPLLFSISAANTCV